MQKEFNITAGAVRVISYQASVEVFYWKNENDGEADSSSVIDHDSCIDFTTTENIEDFISNFEYAAALTPEDKQKLKEELFYYIKPMSSDKND